MGDDPPEPSIFASISLRRCIEKIPGLNFQSQASALLNLTEWVGHHFFSFSAAPRHDPINARASGFRSRLGCTWVGKADALKHEGGLFKFRPLRGRAWASPGSSILDRLGIAMGA